MADTFKVRDLRRKDTYKIDDAYLNGYARVCGIAATAVYNSLSRHADFHTQEAFPSIKKIAQQHGITTRTVIRAIKKLEHFNIIRVQRRRNKQTQKQEPNIYVLIDKIEWSRVTPGKPEPGDNKDASRVTLPGDTRAMEGSHIDEGNHNEGDKSPFYKSSWNSVGDTLKERT